MYGGGFADIVGVCTVGTFSQDAITVKTSPKAYNNYSKTFTFKFLILK